LWVRSQLKILNDGVCFLFEKQIKLKNILERLSECLESFSDCIRGSLGLFSVVIGDFSKLCIKFKEKAKKP
jgi:hypothetical protein